MPDHDVKIVKNGNWKVKPGILGGNNPNISGDNVNVKVGDKITFQAPDDTDVRIFITTEIFGGWGKTKCIKIKKGKGKSQEVKQKAQNSTVYYAVLCTDENEWAEGFSYPSIIID
jgi:hypothetical protein